MKGAIGSCPDSDSRHADDVAIDHSLHWLALLGATGYAWKLHGLLAAIAVLIALLIVISLTNLVVLTQFGNFRLLRVNRWSWVILAFVLLAASGASGGRA